MTDTSSITSTPPFLLIVMGVSGSGKTTLGQALAAHFNIAFLDADDFHSIEARQQMAHGIPLTDTQRAPWISVLREKLASQRQQHLSTVLAFSGLKAAYREQLRHSGMTTVFIFLQSEKADIAHRLAVRQNHFMNPALLDSQFETLEDTSNESDVLSINSKGSPADVLQRALEAIQAYQHHDITDPRN